ncbi:MAG: C4-type zinc ribbon domain-containing protein [Bryobacteraceae bacterium]|jgi:uncharacterized protein
MLQDLKLAVRLQEIDNRLADLTREIATLPKHIAEIEKKLGSHQRKLEADRAALAANQKERKQCEGEIQMQEQKISKLKDQMLQAKTNDQYRAFQNEIEFCEKEIRRFEDRILELMTESEPLDKNVKSAEAALKVEKAQVEAEKQQARERTAEDERAAGDLQGERASIVSSMARSVYDRYERTRKARKGLAIAEVIDGRCSACHLTLRLQFFQDLKRSTEVMTCENCQRILYYNPPVKMEDIDSGAGAMRLPA